MPGCVLASNCTERPSDVQPLENAHTNTRKDLMHNERIQSTEWDMTCPAFFNCLAAPCCLLAHHNETSPPAIVCCVCSYGYGGWGGYGGYGGGWGHGGSWGGNRGYGGYGGGWSGGYGGEWYIMLMRTPALSTPAPAYIQCMQ